MFAAARRGVVLTVAGLLGAFAPGGPATAEPDPAFSLNVSPTRIVVPLGQTTHEAEVMITNRGRSPVQVVVAKRDMRADPQGVVRFVDNAPYSAKDWVTAAPELLNIGPEQAGHVKVQVALPERYEPGDHHVALVFVGTPESTAGGNIRVNGGIGIPVYVAAPGAIDRSVELTSFVAPRFALGGPITFSAAVRHTGTVHRDFRGDSRLAIQVGSRTVEVPEFTLLRDATRDVDVRWEDPPLACVCRATFAVPNLGGGVQLQSATVVIFPVHLVAAVLALVAGAVMVYMLRRRRRVGRP